MTTTGTFNQLLLIECALEIRIFSDSVSFYLQLGFSFIKIGNNFQYCFLVHRFDIFDCVGNDNDIDEAGYRTC